MPVPRANTLELDRPTEGSWSGSKVRRSVRALSCCCRIPGAVLRCWRTLSLVSTSSSAQELGGSCRRLLRSNDNKGSLFPLPVVDGLQGRSAAGCGASPWLRGLPTLESFPNQRCQAQPVEIDDFLFGQALRLVARRLPRAPGLPAGSEPCNSANDGSRAVFPARISR